MTVESSRTWAIPPKGMKVRSGAQPNREPNRMSLHVVLVSTNCNALSLRQSPPHPN